MKRSALALLGAIAVLVGLTGCGNFASSPKEVKEEHALVEACHKAGGEMFRSMFNNRLYCNLVDAK